MLYGNDTEDDFDIILLINSNTKERNITRETLAEEYCV